MPDRDDVIRRLEKAASAPVYTYDEDAARNLARDALTLLREPWRPMSEAPRDGTWIEAWRYDHHPINDAPCVIVLYTLNHTWADDLNRHFEGEDFVGWRPVPPLPEGEGE